MPCFQEVPWERLSERVKWREVKPLTKEELGTSRAQNDPLWLSAQPGGTHHSGMMGSPAAPGWTIFNSTPAKYVEIQNEHQASEAVKFASEHNLEVVVKSTGHDWFGRSTGRGFLLWTHHLTASEWHDAFWPAKCTEPVHAVTLGAGVQFWQVKKEMAERHRVVVTGTCLTVGHVGFTLGGGYGDNSRMYGSGASNLLEAQVVLASGEVITASACNEHKELLVALRGGGAGFGLVLKATYRTHPEPKAGDLGHASGRVWGTPAVALERVLEWYDTILAKGMAKHFGGQLQMSGDHVLVNLKFVELPEAECTQLLKPLGVECKASDFHDYESGNQGGAAPGLQPWWELSSASSYHVGSMTRYVLPRHLAPPARGRLAQAVAAAFAAAQRSAPGNAPVVVAFNYGLGFGSDVAVGNFNETSAHPQVAEAVATVKLDWTKGRDGGPFLVDSHFQVDQSVWRSFQSARAAVDEVLTGSGSYFNEGDFSEQNWQSRYWGSRYSNLLRVKEKYDPQNLFSCHQCVGSENGKGCLRRLSSPPIHL